MLTLHGELHDGGHEVAVGLLESLDGLGPGDTRLAYDEVDVLGVKRRCIDLLVVALVFGLRRLLLAFGLRRDLGLGLQSEECRKVKACTCSSLLLWRGGPIARGSSRGISRRSQGVDTVRVRVTDASGVSGVQCAGVARL